MTKNAEAFDCLVQSPSTVAFLKKHGMRHRWYCHYTSLVRIKQMCESKMLWLTGCDSKSFDDTIEQQKYGCVDVQKRLYFACISHFIQGSEDVPQAGAGIVLDESVLESGLQKWAERRGL